MSAKQNVPGNSVNYIQTFIRQIYGQQYHENTSVVFIGYKYSVINQQTKVKTNVVTNILTKNDEEKVLKEAAACCSYRWILLIFNRLVCHQRHRIVLESTLAQGTATEATTEEKAGTPIPKRKPTVSRMFCVTDIEQFINKIVGPKALHHQMLYSH